LNTGGQYGPVLSRDSVLSDGFGVSGQRMLEALLKGSGSAQEIAEMARQKARQKIPQIALLLPGHTLVDVPAQGD